MKGFFFLQLPAQIRNHRCLEVSSSARLALALNSLIRSESVLHSLCPAWNTSTSSCSHEPTLSMLYSGHFNCGSQRNYMLRKFVPQSLCGSMLENGSFGKRSYLFGPQNLSLRWKIARNMSNASVFELNTDGDFVRFNLGEASGEGGSRKKGKQKVKQAKMSRKRKLNELRFYRLKAKKKMNSPNPEVRIRYKLEKAKRKEAWLIEKLRKYDVPKAPPETHDPEILTEEERFYLKRTGDKKKNYVPVGRRGVFGGVVLNMHLHWKKHETVKVVCKPCRPGQVHQYAEELARLSKGIVMDIKPNNVILLYRGKNYVQPDVMSPPDTLSKAKALEKYRYEQSLEHTSEFIEKLENELEEYQKHVARFKKDQGAALGGVKSNT